MILLNIKKKYYHLKALFQIPNTKSHYCFIQIKEGFLHKVFIKYKIKRIWYLTNLKYNRYQHCKHQVKVNLIEKANKIKRKEIAKECLYLHWIMIKHLMTNYNRNLSLRGVRTVKRIHLLIKMDLKVRIITVK